MNSLFNWFRSLFCVHVKMDFRSGKVEVSGPRGKNYDAAFNFGTKIMAAYESQRAKDPLHDSDHVLADKVSNAVVRALKGDETPE